MASLTAYVDATTAAPSKSTHFLNTTPDALSELAGSTFTDIAVRPGHDLWAAGLGSITRFDGHGVETHELPGINNTGLPVARIAEIFVGPLQEIWAASFDGRVFRFNPSSGQFEVSGIVKLPSAEIKEAKYDGRTGLWIGFSDGRCLIFDIEMGTSRHRCQAKTAAIVDFFFENDLALILSEDGQVFRIDSQRETIPSATLHDCGSQDIQFTDIAATSNESILIGSQGRGLFICSLQRPNLVEPIKGPGTGELRRSTVHEIIVDETSRNFVIATDSGLDVLNGRSLAVEYSSRHATDIVGTEFTALAMQDSNTIWASSFAGLHRLHATPTSVIKSLPGIPSPSVVGFSEWDGKIVIADYTGLFIAKQIELLRSRSSSISRLCDVAGGITATASWNGSFVYGLRSGGVFELLPESEPGECVTSAIALGIGPISTIQVIDNALIVGTFGNGAFRFDRTKGLEEIEATKTASPSKKRILHIEPVGDTGHLLLTEGGIVAVPNHRDLLRPLQNISTLVDGTIPWAASTYGSHLWLATPTDGVYAISLEGFPVSEPSIISHHRLPGEVIQAVEAISQTHAMVSSTTSLFSLFTNGAIERTFHTSGSNTVRFDFAASRQVSEGVLFGGTGGLAFVAPEKLEPSSSAVLHRITSYAIDGNEHRLYRPLAQADRVILGTRNRRLTFKVGSLVPWATQDLELRFRLKGFDSDWSQGTSRNEISYTNLAPGLYEFQSQARTLGGSWESNILSLPVEVPPSWWRSNVALLAYLFAAAALSVFFKHYYETVLLSRRANQLAREMTATAEQAMEDMQEEAETQARLLENVTSRNVATLSWIAELVGRQADTLPDALSSDMAKVSLERIQAFVCLEHALRYRHDRVLADLHSFTDECSALLFSRRSRANAVTLINETSDTLIDAEHAARLATVIYELLTNALDHAYAGRQHGNFLRVALEFSRKPKAEAVNAMITVEDNGVGLPEGIALEAYETAGFALVHEVIAHYGGRLEQKSGGAGTSLRVELPLPGDALA